MKILHLNIQNIVKKLLHFQTMQIFRQNIPESAACGYVPFGKMIPTIKNNILVSIKIIMILIPFVFF